MDDEEVDLAIAEIERRWSEDESNAARRARRARRLVAVRVAAVVASLISALILLTVGLASTSWSMWLAGLVVFLLAFAVDPDRTATDTDREAVVDPGVDRWDVCVSVSGTWSSTVGELRASDGLARWCPTVRQFADGEGEETSFSVGRWRPLRLEVQRRWFAEGIRWCARGGGPTVTGYLRCQPAVTGDEVVVWVHAEARRCRRSRRVLRVIRRETRIGLQRWAMERSTSTQS